MGWGLTLESFLGGEGGSPSLPPGGEEGEGDSERECFVLQEGKKRGTLFLGKGRGGQRETGVPLLLFRGGKKKVFLLREDCGGYG